MRLSTHYLTASSLVGLGLRVLAGAFAGNGMTDGQAFVVRNMIDGASSHLIIAPAVAVLAGAASMVAYSMFKSIISSVCIFTRTIARPPFVMVGLILLGLGLTSASALFAGFRTVAAAHQRPSAP